MERQRNEIHGMALHDNARQGMTWKIKMWHGKEWNG
jgi:hypothetical protein